MRIILPIFLLACLCWASACDSRVSAPRVKTLIRLKNVYYLMGINDNGKNEGIVYELGVNTNTVALQEKWVHLLVEIGAREGINSNVIVDQFCRDGYGRFFNVDFRTNLISHCVSGNLTNIDFPLTVWSSGSNGINDFGLVDDIIFTNALESVRNKK